MKVALYIRVSTVYQAEEGYSLEAQEQILRKYCAERGYIVYDVYVDAGISGKDIKHRPGIQRLLADARNRSFQQIVVWKLTRFTRSLKDLMIMVEELDKYDIRFLSYSEGIGNENPSSRMVMNIMGVIAQFEREIISENTKLAMAERAMQGKCTCTYVLGYDYVDDQLIINKNEARLVQRIYLDYIDTRSMVKVIDGCILRGDRGKRGRLLRHPEKVKRILTRPIYIGFNSFKGRTYKGSHQPIIDTATFDTVQRIIQSKRK